MKQLTQLISHMFIQAYTDYWNVRPAVRPYVLNSLISALILNRNSYIYGFGTHSVFVYCFGLNSAIFTEWDSFQYSCTALVLNSVILNRNSYIYGFGTHSVLVYCFGLNSAIFTEWDSFQYSCTALVLNQSFSPYWDSVQCSFTVLVLIQLYLLNGTHSSIRILFWS